MRGVQALVGGRVFLDLVMHGVRAPEPGGEVFAQSFLSAPGGAATRAVAAARLGLPTGLVTAVGDDDLGGLVTAALAAEPGLATDRVARRPGVRTAVSVALTDGSDRSFVTYEEAGTAPPDRIDPLPAGVRIAHVGLAEGVPSWATALRATGTELVGGIGWDETGRWDPALLDRLSAVDAFVPNADEATRYTRTTDPRAAARRLAERVRLVCVTLGEQGALAVDAATGEEVLVPAPPAVVRDPTGAGDCFVGALLLGRAAGWDLRTTVAASVLAASLSVERLGGSSAAPRADELAAGIDRGLAHEDLPAADWGRVLTDLRAGSPA